MVDYDYGEMLAELLEELDDGVLSGDSEIYVIRENNAKNMEYVPIIDWFYVDDLQETLQEDYNKDCIFEKLQLNDVMEEMFLKNISTDTKENNTFNLA